MYILLFNFTWRGIMRHEKSLGRYCRRIFERENTPLMRPLSLLPLGVPQETPTLHPPPWAPRTVGRPPRTVTLLFVMNGFTRPQIIAMFIFRTVALLVIQFNGVGIWIPDSSPLPPSFTPPYRHCHPMSFDPPRHLLPPCYSSSSTCRYIAMLTSRSQSGGLSRSSTRS